MLAADLTHPAPVVKAVLGEKRTAGKAAWKDFEEERTRLVRSGAAAEIDRNRTVGATAV